MEGWSHVWNGEGRAGRDVAVVGDVVDVVERMSAGEASLNTVHVTLFVQQFLS